MLENLGKLGDYATILRRAQEAKENIERTQEKLTEILVVGEAGVGLVTVTADATGRIREIRIDPTLLSEPPALIEDLLMTAVNNALEKGRNRSQEELARVCGDLGLPHNPIQGL